MNKTSIEWTDYSWNPITGCHHNCPYCYAKKITKRFPKGFPNGFAPTFYENRLSEPETLKHPSRIFTVSMGDMFGEWVPGRWIEAVLTTTQLFEKHTYQILTKNPKRIYTELYGGKPASWLAGGDYFSNVWFGTSVSEPKDLFRIEHLKRLKKQSEGWTLFVSFEPLIEKMPSELDLSGIDWVIVGAQTNPLKLPSIETIASVIKEADNHQIPVFLKDTVVDIWPECRREFPKGGNA